MAALADQVECVQSHCCNNSRRLCCAICVAPKVPMTYRLGFKTFQDVQPKRLRKRGVRVYICVHKYGNIMCAADELIEHHHIRRPLWGQQACRMYVLLSPAFSFLGGSETAVENPPAVASCTRLPSFGIG